ncbi:MAG: response regulator transcription factor [Candidatus Zixiibacteriota bacterium]
MTNDNGNNILLGNLVVHRQTRTVAMHGHSIRLTWAEFDLLNYLIQNPGRTITRDELFENLLGVEYNGLDRTIDVRVSRLRRKLEREPGEPRIIQSVRSEGYCLTISQPPEHTGDNR